MAEHYLDDSVVHAFWDNSYPPRLEIEPGDTVIFECREAVDGQDAVHLVAERHPDVVLMDIQMPVMDGLEATRRIKSQWPQVRVIALTIYARYRAKALSAGADVFLVKGCVSEALQDAILAQRSESSELAKWPQEASPCRSWIAERGQEP